MAQSVIIDLPGPIASADVVARPASVGGAAGAAAASSAAAPAMSASARLAEAEARLGQEREALAQARAAMEDAAQKMLALQSELIAQAEAQVVDLALAIAEKVLVQEIDQGRAKIEPVVREALRHLPARRDLVVRVNPQDLAQWQQAAPAEGPAATAGAVMIAGLKVVADAGLKRGECVAESAEGAVAATIADRMQAAGAAMRQG